MHTNKPRLVVIEGPDGSGKTVLLKRTKARLDEVGTRAIETREPGGTPAGEAIRGVLLGDFGLPKTSQLLLFYAARFNLLESVTIPALAKGNLVLLDRFELSSYVYQVAGTDQSIHDIFIELSRAVKERLDTAGAEVVYLVLDVTFAEAERRLASRARRNHYDSTDEKKFDARRAAYKDGPTIFPHAKFHFLDTTNLSEDDVFESAWNTLFGDRLRF
jgi:dTMP kinase